VGLAEQQVLLARLYTDADLRQRFFAEPTQVGARLGLSTPEAQNLARLSVPQVSRFAASLHAKRLKAVRRLLPCTGRALGERFAPSFRRHATGYVSQGTKRHRDDAIAFSDFLARMAQTKAEQDQQEQHPLEPWVADIARYEAAWLYMVNSGRPGLLVRRFGYPIAALMQVLARDQVPPTPARRPCLGLWLRPSLQGDVRHLVLSLPVSRRESLATGDRFWRLRR
jgi:hypothetical protein